MKNNFKRLAIGIMCTIVSISAILPIQVAAVLATEDDTQIIENNPSNMPSANSSTDQILYEVEEKRDEFSKTYFLADGSYYTCISPVALHIYTNDKWCDISDDLSQTPQNIEAAENAIKDFVTSCNGNAGISVASTTQQNVGLQFTCIGDTVFNSTENKYTISKKASLGALAIKPTVITNLSATNKKLISAEITFEATTESSNGNFYLKILKADVSASTSASSIKNNADIFLAHCGNGSETCTLDITDMYSKWERGILNNFGVALTSNCKEGFTISVPILNLRYRDESLDNTGTTYHTLDLGRAGVLSINDVTNTFVLEQTLAGIDCAILPATLKMLTTSYNKTLRAYGNVSSIFNYDYSIEFNNNYATFTTPNGTVIQFKQPENVDSTAAYQEWEQITNFNLIGDGVLTLTKEFVNTRDAFELVDCYAEIDGFQYWFNSMGKVARIQKMNKTLNVNYVYNTVAGKPVIDQITDGDGNQYCISYSTYAYNNRTYLYANKIEVKDSNNVPIKYDNTYLEINVSNIISNGQIISTYQYGRNETDSTTNLPTVVYTYDNTGNLLNIVDETGIKTVFEYKSTTNNYLTGYTQYDSNDIPIKEFSIDSSNTYERIFIETSKDTEIQRYDTDFRLITYYYGTDVIGITYDENGNMNSYVSGNSDFNESENLVESGDFSAPDPFDNWFVYFNEPDWNDALECVEITSTSTNTYIGLTQTVENLRADTTYIFSTKANVLESTPSHSYKFVANIILKDSSDNVVSDISLPFDLSLINDEQIRMCSFKTDVSCDADISVYVYGDVGEMRFDDVRLYEAKDNSLANIPGVTISQPVDKTYNEDGLLIKEEISNSTDYLAQTYDYVDNSGKATSMTDYNGVTTYFDYKAVAGLLTDMGYERNSENNSIVNPTTFAYNSEKLLQSVSHIIDIPNNSNDLIYSTNYTYDAKNRVQSIINGNYSYIFNYDNDGKIISVDRKIGDETPTNLVTKDNTTGTVTYSNGYQLVYIYDSENNNQIETIGWKDANGNYVCSYNYEYTNGTLSKVSIDSVNTNCDFEINYTAEGTSIYRDFGGENKICIYSKSKTTNAETFIHSFNDTNVTTTYSETPIMETVNNNTTELYSSFDATKIDSSFTNNILYDGEKVVIKDYFGRVSTKASDITIANSADSENIYTADTLVSHNYTYKTLQSLTNDNPKQQTSNLVETVDNILSSVITETKTTETGPQTTTQNINGNIKYAYVYDERGNIIFVYTVEDDVYYFTSFYTYDELNQVTASLSDEVISLYEYDTKGNMTSWNLCDELYVSCLNNIDPETIGVISAEHWENYKNNVLPNTTVTVGQPYLKFDYQYSGDRLIHVSQNECSYSENGDLITNSVLSFDINYDTYGNPDKYISFGYDGIIVTELTWIGSCLETALIKPEGGNPTSKILFAYDENGNRISKTLYDCDTDSSAQNGYTLSENNTLTYLWENGQLTGYIYSVPDSDGYVHYNCKILYDNMGYPYGYIAPSGQLYYFILDVNNSITGLVLEDGTIIANIYYDAFGRTTIDANGNSTIENIVYTIMAMYNPCTYKGYMFDYDLGMYFIQDRFYSPITGRFVNATNYEELAEPKTEVLASNPYLFCKNNPVTNFDPTAEWSRERYDFHSAKKSGINVEMNEAFLSRSFCTLYASKILKECGTWDYLTGQNYEQMNIESIASTLFARAVGYYAEDALNRVNARWGDGWVVANRTNPLIVINENDTNISNYKKIWEAAPTIKLHAIKSGVHITL